MTFKEWADEALEADWENPIYLSVVTDGLSKTKSSVVAVITAEEIDAQIVVKEYGILGGDASKTEAFTGFTHQMHRDNITAPSDMPTLPMLFDGRVVVSYSVNKFMMPFLEKLQTETILPVLGRASDVLDIQSMYNVVFSEQGLIRGNTASFLRTQAPAGKLEKLFDNIPIADCLKQEVYNMPVYRQKVYILYWLYKYLRTQ